MDFATVAATVAAGIAIVNVGIWGYVLAGQRRIHRQLRKLAARDREHAERIAGLTPHDPLRDGTRSGRGPRRDEVVDDGHLWLEFPEGESDRLRDLRGSWRDMGQQRGHR